MEDARVEKTDRSPPRGASHRKPRIPYPFELRLKAVKLYLESKRGQALQFAIVSCHASSFFQAPDHARSPVLALSTFSLLLMVAPSE